MVSNFFSLHNPRGSYAPKVCHNDRLGKEQDYRDTKTWNHAVLRPCILHRLIAFLQIGENGERASVITNDILTLDGR